MAGGKGSTLTVAHYCLSSCVSILMICDQFVLGNVSLLSKLGRFVYIPSITARHSFSTACIVSPLVVVSVMQMPLDAPLLDRPLVLTLIQFPGLTHRFVIRMVWRNLGSSVAIGSAVSRFFSSTNALFCSSFHSTLFEAEAFVRSDRGAAIVEKSLINLL